MARVALTREAHFRRFVAALARDSDANEFEFERFDLPRVPTDRSESYVPLKQVIEFLHSMALRHRIHDPGYLATRFWTIRDLDPGVVSCVRHQSTLGARLQRFGQLCSIENPDLRFSIHREGSFARVILDLDTTDIDHVELSNWLQVAALNAIIADALGYIPPLKEVTLQANYRPSARAHEELPASRLFSGARHTSILLPVDVLYEACRAPRSSSRERRVSDCNRRQSVLGSADLATRLRLALPSYVQEGLPKIDDAADLVGMSARSLQRELAESGTSYTDMVQDVILDQAQRLLADPNRKIIDVALDVGYRDASHFSRAFRRQTGMSPRDYRKKKQIH